MALKVLAYGWSRNVSPRRSSSSATSRQRRPATTDRRADQRQRQRDPPGRLQDRVSPRAAARRGAPVRQPGEQFARGGFGQDVDRARRRRRPRRARGGRGSCKSTRPCGPVDAKRAAPPRRVQTSSTISRQRRSRSASRSERHSHRARAHRRATVRRGARADRAAPRPGRRARRPSPRTRRPGSGARTVGIARQRGREHRLADPALAVQPKRIPHRPRSPVRPAPSSNASLSRPRSSRVT